MSPFPGQYDPDGNCVERTCISSGVATGYTWDNRDRLTAVTTYASYADYAAAQAGGTVTPTQVVQYTYDVENRWIGEQVYNGAVGDGNLVSNRQFVYDGNQIVLQFDKATSGAATVSDLSHRYLWGPAVDQLLADEQLLPSTPGPGYNLSAPGTTVWALTNNQGSVVDLATYASSVTTIATHRVYNSYGNLLSQTPNPAAVDCLFGYTGRPFDTETGLQNNDNRWYEPITHRWLSPDPAAADVNLYRYCGNGPTNGTDPSGLGEKTVEQLRETVKQLSEDLAQLESEGADSDTIQAVKNTLRDAQNRVYQARNPTTVASDHKQRRNAAHADPEYQYQGVQGPDKGTGYKKSPERSKLDANVFNQAKARACETTRPAGAAGAAPPVAAEAESLAPVAAEVESLAPVAAEVESLAPVAAESESLLGERAAAGEMKLGGAGACLALVGVDIAIGEIDQMSGDKISHFLDNTVGSDFSDMCHNFSRLFGDDPRYRQHIFDEKHWVTGDDSRRRDRYRAYLDSLPRSTEEYVPHETDNRPSYQQVDENGEYIPPAQPVEYRYDPGRDTMVPVWSEKDTRQWNAREQQWVEEHGCQG